MKALFNITYTTKSPRPTATQTEKMEHLQRRQFYDMSADYNYFTYTLNGEKTIKNKDINEYMNKEGTGLFNADKIFSKEDIKALKDKLKKTDSIIWHGFISFDTDTSKGFNTTENAQKFLRSTFNVLLERSGLNPKNVEMFASMHYDTPIHRHIHLAFFEKEPKRRDSKGKLGYTLKGKLPKPALENFLVSANMHLDERQYDYYSARDRAMDKLKSRTGAQINRYGDVALKAAINQLCTELPKTGRLQYNSANIKPFRKKIDEAVILLLNSCPEAKKEHMKILEEFAHKEKQVQKICQEGSIGYVQQKVSTNKADRIITGKGKATLPNIGNVDYIQRLKEEYKGRLGNRVLALVKEMKTDKTAKLRAGVNDKILKIEARRKRELGLINFEKAINSMGLLTKAARADFTAELIRVEREIEQQVAQAQ